MLTRLFISTLLMGASATCAWAERLSAADVLGPAAVAPWIIPSRLRD